MAYWLRLEAPWEECTEVGCGVLRQPSGLLGLIIDHRMLALGSMSDARFRDLQSSLNILDINFRELISL